MEKSSKFLNWFIIVLFIVFFAIIILLILKPKSQYSFALTPEETLQMAISQKDFISPVQLSKKIVSKDKDIIIVDIRNQFDYIKGHLPGAENIYKADILEKDKYNYFKKLQEENKTAVFYGNDVVEANIPYMILKQVGINNIKVLNGAYSDFENIKIEEIAKLGELNLDKDEPALEFFSVIKKENEKDMERIKLEQQKKLKRLKPQPKKKAIIVKKQKIDIPEPEEEEEDEGC